MSSSAAPPRPTPWNYAVAPVPQLFIYDALLDSDRKLVVIAAPEYEGIPVLECMGQRMHLFRARNADVFVSKRALSGAEVDEAVALALASASAAPASTAAAPQSLVPLPPRIAADVRASNFSVSGTPSALNNTTVRLCVNTELLALAERVRGKIVMATMMRAEEPVVRAWVEFHRRLGVDHFLIYDNAAESAPSTLADALLGLEDCVTVVRWPFPKRLPYSDISGQATANNHALRALSTAAWVGFFDVDEYVNPQCPLPLRALLDTYGEHVGGVVLLCKTFYNPRGRPVVGNNFLWFGDCAPRVQPVWHAQKMFCHPRNVSAFNIHDCASSAPSAIAMPCDAFFNHYVFLNKPQRGDDETGVQDCSILRHVAAAPT